MRTVLVSTGKASSPTRAGKVLSKHPSITMRGQAFLSPGVLIARGALGPLRERRRHHLPP